jgi:hypothetical protein
MKYFEAANPKRSEVFNATYYAFPKQKLLKHTYINLSLITMGDEK